MKALSRFFAWLSQVFELRASAKDLERRIASLEAKQAQLTVDMAKCKMMVGLNQLTEVTADNV